MILKMWKQEFSLSAFSLKYEPIEHFVQYQWQKDEKVLFGYMIQRFSQSLYFIASFMLTLPISDSEQSHENLRKYFIFLTNWTYFLETVYFVLGTVVVMHYVNRLSRLKPITEMTWCLKLLWILYNIVLPGAFSVTLIFWAAVFDPELYPLSLNSVLLHVFNSVFMLIEFLTVAHPIKLLHFYWPLCYATLYIVFSAIYQLCGGTGTKGMIPIYKILDWRNAGRTMIVCLGCTTLLLIFHVIFSVLHILKVWIRRKYVNVSV